MTSIVVRILCCGVSQKQKDAAHIGRKVLIEIICFTLKKKLPYFGQLLVLYDANMYYLIISKLLFTKAVNASPFNKF
jgi:hypothetical protein